MVDGVLTSETAKICNSFYIYSTDHPTNIYEPLPFCSSHNIDHLDFNDRSMFLGCPGNSKYRVHYVCKKKKVASTMFLANFSPCVKIMLLIT